MDEIAGFETVSRRRIYQLKQQYKDAGFIPELKDSGRNKKLMDPEFERISLDTYQIYKSGSVMLEKMLKIH